MEPDSESARRIFQLSKVSWFHIPILLYLWTAITWLFQTLITLMVPKNLCIR